MRPLIYTAWGLLLVNPKPLSTNTFAHNDSFLSKLNNI